ncbi:Solute carrier family 13 [Trinorchestia longiramus]|nr:Solute carrier family 13 [Trinorchestia longiramus]
MPVLKDLSVGIKVNPVYMMMPTAVACSYAFMLPVATPPNAIVFGAANMKSVTMLKAGLVMNVICVLVATLMINTLGVAMFDLNNFPDWAVPSANHSLASLT